MTACFFFFFFPSLCSVHGWLLVLLLLRPTTLTTRPRVRYPQPGSAMFNSDLLRPRSSSPSEEQAADTETLTPPPGHAPRSWMPWAWLSRRVWSANRCASAKPPPSPAQTVSRRPAAVQLKGQTGPGQGDLVARGRFWNMGEIGLGMCRHSGALSRLRHVCAHLKEGAVRDDQSLLCFLRLHMCATGRGAVCERE